MKNNMMKKLLTLVLAGAMTLSLAACGAKDTQPIEQPDNSTEEAKTYKVAVSSSTTLPSMRSRTPSPPSWIRFPPITA